jgi:hypothetical protein
VRVSNIRVSRWQGNLEEVADGPETAAGKDDLLVLANRDKISGHLLGIKEGKLSFKTQFTPMEIPLERVRRIALAAGPAATPPKTGKPVRLVFANRGSLTLDLERWDEQGATGRSPCLGEVKLVSSAFKSIEFDLTANKPATVTPSTTIGPRRVGPIAPVIMDDVQMQWEVQPAPDQLRILR